MHALFSRSAVAVATLALAGSALALTAPAAQAAPVFTDADTELVPFGDVFTDDFNQSGTDCTTTDPGTVEPGVPVVENGAVASAATSVSGTYANAGNAADTGSGSGSASGTAKITSAAGNVRTLDFTAQSRSQLTNALGTSPDCYRAASAGVQFDFEFKVAQAGFLTLTGKNVGPSYGSFSVYRNTTSGPQVYAGSNGSGLKFNAQNKVFLDAGTYRGSFQGSAFVSGAAGSNAGTTTVHGTFAVAGAQTEAVSGKGKKYLTLPSARSCATHVLGLEVTDKKKRADRIKQVKVFVNDAKAKKVRTPDKGESIKVAIADDVTADVRAEVTLVPAKKGKKAKSYTVSASYEACS